MNQIRSVDLRPRNRIATVASLTGAVVIAMFLAWLLYGRDHLGASPSWVTALPAVAASANAACAIALGLGWRAIRTRRVRAHRNLMLSAVFFSALFFVSYVVRHYYHGDTPFGGTGWARTVFLSVLTTHIAGSIVVLALLPISLRFAWLQNFASHKAVNRWLLPVWLYVSVTGVVVYFVLR